MLYQSNQPFNPKFAFKNKHFNTFYRYLFTKTKIDFKRKRMYTKDGDFLDLDCSIHQADKLIVAIHGLEGSSNSSYIKSLTALSNNNDYDIIALNLRSCSGETNNLLSSYHSGKSEDLLEVIQYIEKNYSYKKIFVVGFSLGGNITLKFMGESKINTVVNAAVAVSVPCSLAGSSKAMNEKQNKIYVLNFLTTLRRKAKLKFKKFPNCGLQTDMVLKAKNFNEFDNFFTAPTNGFKNALDYYEKSSSKPLLAFIEKPTLLITALDDPFLNKDCYPTNIAKQSKHFHLLTTKYGGHVGFCHSFNMKKNNWLENEILTFLKNNN